MPATPNRSPKLGPGPDSTISVSIFSKIGKDALTTFISAREIIRSNKSFFIATKLKKSRIRRLYPTIEVLIFCLLFLHPFQFLGSKLFLGTVLS